MSDYWILNGDGIPVLEPDLFVWARWMQTADRHLALDMIGDVRVSTVFLGLDHSWQENGPPVLWESMVFGGKHCGDMRRYTRRDDALTGHAVLREMVRAEVCWTTDTPAASGADAPSRDDYIAECKTRALAYVDAGQLQDAFSSLINDLNKRTDTQVTGVLADIGFAVLNHGCLLTADRMRDFIRSINYRFGVISFSGGQE